MTSQPASFPATLDLAWIIAGGVVTLAVIVAVSVWIRDEWEYRAAARALNHERAAEKP